MAAPGPWADLNADLLDRIFSRLPTFYDRASCSCVCRPWRLAATREEHAPPPQFPWLFRPSRAGCSSYLRVFSRTTADRPSVPEGARFCGAMPGGWFVVARGRWRGYELLNLVSGARVPLPDGLRARDRDREAPPPLDLRVGVQPSALVILAATAFPAPAPDGDGDGDGEDYTVAAIAFGHHNAVVFRPGMDRWVPFEAAEGMRGPALGRRIMREELEDVAYYSCDNHEGFYFLTSREHLLVFDPELEDDDAEISGDLDDYLFLNHKMSAPPGAEQVVAGRYLVESDGWLLMVKRFVSPDRGTAAFQVFRLEWGSNGPSWESCHPAFLAGKMFFIGRGCSRAVPTGRDGPAFIYFLDDAEGFPDVHAIIRTEKLYRCGDAGWCLYDPQYVCKNWPEGPPPDCSPWIWFFH